MMEPKLECTSRSCRSTEVGFAMEISHWRKRVPGSNLRSIGDANERVEAAADQTKLVPSLLLHETPRGPEIIPSKCCYPLVLVGFREDKWNGATGEYDNDGRKSGSGGLKQLWTRELEIKAVIGVG